MAEIAFSDSAERDQFNLVHFFVGMVVLTTGIYFAAIAARYLFLG